MWLTVEGAGRIDVKNSRAIASRPDVLAALSAILSDHTHPHWLRAWPQAADGGYGKSAQHFDVKSGSEQLQHFTLGIGRA